MKAIRKKPGAQPEIIEVDNTLKAGTDVLFWRPLPQLPEVQE